MNLLRRVTPMIQWALVAALLAAAVVIGTGVVRQWRDVTGVTTDAASAADEGPPPLSVPARAISLPVLLFDDEKGVRVGDSATHIAALLGRGAEVGRYEVDTGTGGERLTRFYAYRGRRFALVFTLAETHIDPAVTAIYLQE